MKTSETNARDCDRVILTTLAFAKELGFPMLQIHAISELYAYAAGFETVLYSLRNRKLARHRDDPEEWNNASCGDPACCEDKPETQPETAP